MLAWAPYADYVNRLYTIEEMPQNSYTVEVVEGAEYGFSLNENGYYESENAGVDYSYAICKIKINSHGI